MAWTDMATQVQLFQIRQFLRRCVSSDIAMKAAYFLHQKGVTRRETSQEMSRLRDLYYRYVRDPGQYFTGELWDGFDWRHPELAVEQTKSWYELMHFE